MTSTNKAAGVTLGELVDLLQKNRTGDPSFADDLEEIQAQQPVLPPAPRLAVLTARSSDPVGFLMVVSEAEPPI